MVDIAVTLDSSACLKQLEMRGHAEFADGGVPDSEMNPVCGIVSLVARSVARLIAGRPGWQVDGEAPAPGNLSLVVVRRPEDTDEWLRGVTDSLMQALADVAGEYPRSVSVHTEESCNGS